MLWVYLSGYYSKSEEEPIELKEKIDDEFEREESKSKDTKAIKNEVNCGTKSNPQIKPNTQEKLYSEFDNKNDPRVPLDMTSDNKSSK